MIPSLEENVLRGETVSMDDFKGIGETVFEKMVQYGDNIAMVSK